MYGIYGNIDHQYTPNVSIYIYHTWILWVTNLLYIYEKDIFKVPWRSVASDVSVLANSRLHQNRTGRACVSFAGSTKMHENRMNMDKIGPWLLLPLVCMYFVYIVICYVHYIGHYVMLHIYIHICIWNTLLAWESISQANSRRRKPEQLKLKDFKLKVQTAGEARNRWFYRAFIWPQSW